MINATTFTDNTARTGGGVGNYGKMNVSNSVLHGNTAVVFGGGLSNINAAALLTMSSTTVSGNATCNLLAARCQGGGIFNREGAMRLVNSTIRSNQGVVGGVAISFGSVSARNTIISGNLAVGAGTSPEVNRVFNSSGNNLIGNNFESTFFSAAGDVTGTRAAPVDPKLRPLGNYGGTTLTQPPFFDSLAVNAGNNCVLVAGACGDGNPALTTDQRGCTRIGNVTSFVPDIGAVELQTAVVTNISDATTPNVPFASLRSFVEGGFLYDRILFDPTKFANPNTSINLVAPLTINRPLEIFGFNAESPKITGAGRAELVASWCEFSASQAREI